MEDWQTHLLLSHLGSFEITVLNSIFPIKYVCIYIYIHVIPQKVSSLPIGWVSKWPSLKMRWSETWGWLQIAPLPFDYDPSNLQLHARSRSGKRNALVFLQEIFMGGICVSTALVSTAVVSMMYGVFSNVCHSFKPNVCIPVPWIQSFDMKSSRKTI